MIQNHHNPRHTFQTFPLTTYVFLMLVVTRNKTKKKKKEKKLRVDLGVKTGKTVTSSMAGLGLGPRQLTTGYTLAIS